MSFPFHWTEPGEFTYCRKCGWLLVPKDIPLCAKCKYTSQSMTMTEIFSLKNSKIYKELDDLIADMKAYLASLNPEILKENSNIKKIASYTNDDLNLEMEITEQKKQELLQCQAVHDKLYEERDKIATERKTNGIPPLFWMKK